MRSIRRVGGLASAALLLTAVVGSSGASADTPAAYSGSASGYALKLAALGQSLTLGSSASKASSDGTGAATGTGASVVAASVVTASNPPGETKPEACGAVVPPGPLDLLLSLGLGCGSASATGSGLTSSATSAGNVVGLDVNLQTALDQIPIPTGTITAPVTDAFDQLCSALPTELQSAVCSVTSTVEEVLSTVTAAQTLAAEIGASTSAVTVNGTSVTSESTSQAAVIKILPLPVLDGVQLSEPFATVTVSRAQAKTVCDYATGSATPTFDPAIVRVKLSAPIVSLLGQAGIDNPLPIIEIPGNPLINGQLAPILNLQNGEFSVTPGTSVVLFPGLPIETEIAVGSGTATVNPDKTATAAADGVKIHALRQIGAPLADGILLDLAHADAAGGCVQAATEVAAPAPAAPDIPRELPRTGGTPWLPIVGVAGLALAILTRRAVRSH